MRTTTLALVLAATLLAGCGGGTTQELNGEGAKPATQVLADAQKAAVGATSFHVSGNIESGGTATSLHLWLAKGKGAKGSMSTGGLQFDLIRIGEKLYIRGSDAFLKHYAAGAAGLLRGKWLEASATKGKLAPLTSFTSPGALFEAIATHHGKLANDGVKTYDGQKVVEIRDTSDNSKLYVAATGPAYPVAISSGKTSESGAITFSGWNQSVSLSAPQNAIDISTFGLG